MEGDGAPCDASAGPVALEFSRVYEGYFDFVWSCTRRLGVGDNEIDDVVQEIFIVIHGKLSTLERVESLRSWIYGIIRRTVSGYHRSRRARVASAAAFGVEDVPLLRPPTPFELAEQSDQLKFLWGMLAKLDPSKRETFVLAELEEMTAPEIAAALEVPLNTVYTRLRSARHELEAALARHHAQTEKRGHA
jgi:RNA polymerase sigma-70 factor (ECF subfamily)